MARLLDPLDLVRGDDCVIAFRIERNGVAYPLTAWTGQAVMWQHGSPKLTGTVEIAADDGRVVARWQETQTAALDVDRAEGRVRLTSPAGDTKTYIIQPYDVL